MKSTSIHHKILKLVQIAMLSAIVVVIQLCFSSVRIGPVTLAFSLVPIILAGICVGPTAGLIVGAVSGIVTFFQVITSGDPFYVFLITNNPVATAMICLVKSSLAGWLSGLTYNGLRKVSDAPVASSILSAVICPTVNTGIFCLGMLIFFTSAFQADATFGAASQNIIYFVFIGLAGANYIFELFSAVVLTPIISKSLFAAKLIK